ncbi:hypothetical protein LJC34_03935 [Oscillospiraceae bacterium OttesenSCG-928-G22]|nr:hypothetical protein [Oscillospiraceae bacterium OttesenSCG-928-G22]
MAILREALNNFKNYMQMASIMDVVDILIVAFFIYKLIGLIRQTTAGQVLKGVVFVVGGMWLSGALGLRVLSFILENAVQVGLIALIIVFQPELRRMLEQMGATRFPSIFGRDGPTGTMENAIVFYFRKGRKNGQLSRNLLPRGQNGPRRRRRGQALTPKCRECFSKTYSSRTPRSTTGPSLSGRGGLSPRAACSR